MSSNLPEELRDDLPMLLRGFNNAVASAAADEITNLHKENRRLREELQWYGHTIAGGGPMAGYTQAAEKAELRWYDTTLPMLKAANAAGGE